MSEDKATRRPWKYSNLNWCGKPDRHHFYVSGDFSEDEDGETSATSVCVVIGNDTAGEIPEACAKLICRAVNAHDDLLAACEDMLPLLVHAEYCESCADDGIGDQLRSLRRRLAAARAAIAKAKAD